MTRKTKVILLAACLVALALGAMVFKSGDGKPKPHGLATTHAAVDDAHKAKAAGETVERFNAMPAPMIPLPPPDTPLDAIFDDLAQAADAGHVAAACRLAWDLQRCHSLEARSGIPGFYVESAARAPGDSPEEDGLIAEAMAAQDRLARDERVCEGLSADELGQVAGRMLQAAQLGHPASQAMFAIWPPFGPDLSLEEAELALFHRDHAMDFLRKGAASGEPTALFGLFHACHFGEIRMLHGSIELGRDPVCAMATAIALREFADPRTVVDADLVIRESASALDPAGRQEAAKRAAFYRQRFLGQSNFDFAGGIFKSHLRAPCSDL